ncbi:hypothetical protein ACJX0J_020051 [Zea mays]
MAEDIWTLKLQFEGDPPGQKMVQREMDKDEICFFNLIELIEEYGYTSRRDGLLLFRQTQGTNGTVLTHVWDLPKDKRILVKCNQLGQPIGKEGGLSHVIDLLMRLEKIQVNIEKEVILIQAFSISLNLLQHIQGYCFFLETR